ncbi:MAG: dihydroorotate dehydrogenase-like protein [Sulfurimonas sp.]|nr:dihydroorotate dehydrogenase-like protein [Sulfurimonas sp.]MBU3939057.1 dihydroorotate dehydrogenase-like protein [bacterium]MBU4024279.1 dihydroorotate dehydrogenase-like protein [bacterium]MBU4059668.1 dihydroorotate dehydrogenase-like protein [bacterium]MBU4110039.1 dihydroorotate dehydrogenase-like protein [bacterium]
MNLKTKYLGLELKNPLIAGASPLTASVDSIKRLEDAGVAAVVMHSLFEEQINKQLHAIDYFLFNGSDSYAESLSYFPASDCLQNAEAEHYLEDLAEIKKATDIPIIASLNGVSSGGWVNYAKKLQEAGADALELNITYIPTDFSMDSHKIERMYLDVLKDVKTNTSLPLAVKMNAYFTNPAQMAKRFEEGGVDGLVIFDNPVRVDIDLETLTAVQKANLTSSSNLSETLRWCAILYSNVNLSLAASTGIHSAEDVLKALMSGANATQMASALLQNGPEHVKSVLDEMTLWMQEKEYVSVEQMIGSISLKHTDNPAAFERSNYMRALLSYRY